MTLEPSQSCTSSGAVAPLEVVDIRHELARRPRRASRLEEEHRAFVLLAAEMATNPRNMLQKVVELAVDVCDAHTAGISLLDGDVFRWEAVAGVFASRRGGTMPRDQSPCGVCIDRNETQLMHLADRCFPALSAEPRFVEALLVPFHARGVPIGTVWLVSHDEHRRFDREDERIVSQLSQFTSAAWQLLRSSEQLAQMNRQKDDFLAVLGHELRNPLAAIFAATAVLKTRVGGDPTAAAATGMLDRQSRHLRRLADDLLDIARIEAGKLWIERRLVDARTIVEDAVEAMRAQIQGRGHSLELERGGAPIWLEADPIRLAQVVSNLVDNAAKYTPENGKIAVSVSKGDGWGVIVVRDNGVGIPEDRKQLIFEPFKQLPQSSRTTPSGIGLGLALVKSLVELHGGTITVESNGAAPGTRFSVRLPLSATVLESPSARSPHNG